MAFRASVDVMALAPGFPRLKGPKVKATPKARRRRTAEQEYADARNRVLKAAGGRCMARFSVECSGRASMTHHVVPRSRGGGNDTLLATCAACHLLIHAEPEQARARGLLLTPRDLA